MVMVRLQGPLAIGTYGPSYCHQWNFDRQEFGRWKSWLLIYRCIWEIVSVTCPLPMPMSGREDEESDSDSGSGSDSDPGPQSQVPSPRFFQVPIPGPTLQVKVCQVRRLLFAHNRSDRTIDCSAPHAHISPLTHTLALTRIFLMHCEKYFIVL